MKRIVLITCIALLAGINCKAASDNDTTRYLASTMKQNWFIGANASINWWQGSDLIPAGNFTTLNGPSFGGGVFLGKWITHNIGFRLVYDVNPGQSYISGRHPGKNYEFLYGDDPQPITVFQDGAPYNYYQTAFMYHNMRLDLLISPRDIIEGFYYKRKYIPIIVAGMGVASVSEYPLLLQSVILKEAVNYELTYCFGLMNLFRLNDYFDIDLSLLLQGQRFSIDSWGNEYNPDNGTVRPKRVDHNYKASLGIVCYPFGRIYELPYNYEKEMKELRERLEECEGALDGTEGSTEGIQGTQAGSEIIHDTAFIVTPGEFISYPLSIFFERDSYDFMSSRDLINLREIAKVAKEHGCKIKLRGSCDSATATAQYNQRLSENRCNKVMQELVKMGVPDSKITYDAVGGVKELDPTKYDRRVIITLIKD